MITVNDIKKAIESYINDDIENEKIFNELLPFIKENDGKRIDGWFERRFKKAFPEYCIDYIAGMTNIKAGKAQRSYLVSHNAAVSLETFINNNTWCQEKEHNRIAKNRAITAETMQLYCNHLNAVNSAAEFLDKSNFDIPAHYSLCRLIPWEVKKRRD